MCGTVVNNEFYKELGDKWFTSEGDVVALLRQENKTKLPWVREKIREAYTGQVAKILDVGCGGGFLALALAADGHNVTGLDIASSVLAAGISRDVSSQVNWVEGAAEKLPFAGQSFDVVCIMDVLEHVTDFRQVVREGMRVLKPGGILLMHTFNRTWLSWLVAERGVAWLIKGAPTHLHDWKLFVKPDELRLVLFENAFVVREICGIRPVLWSTAFLRLLFTRRVPASFEFALCQGLQVGYLMYAARDTLNLEGHA